MAAQVELFTAYGHYQPAGAVRVTWLHIAAQQGHVGLGTGSPSAGSANFLQQVRTPSNTLEQHACDRQGFGDLMLLQMEMWKW